MKTYPCAKINLGLNIVSRRDDGYHNLQTIFYPIPIHDEITILPAPATTFKVDNSLLQQEDAEHNLVMRAYRLLQRHYQLPPVAITLSKHIPMQAGMGGGSSDAAYTLTLLNSLFQLQLAPQQLVAFAATLGADCPFFIQSQPAYAEGIGEQLTPVSVDLSPYHLVIVKPPVAVSTRDAFALITPQQPPKSCRDIVGQPVTTWRHELTNDFERSIFTLHPQLAHIKDTLYRQGALYAAMSGSGSALFAISSHPLTLQLPQCQTFHIPPKSNV